MMKSRPIDFSVRYEWSEGSVPPPYHYQYTIRIGPGSKGEIVFLPDYSMHEPPAWTETFDVDDQVLDELYTLMVEKGVFSQTWTEIEDPPIGGSLEWLEVTAHGEYFRVPSMIEEAEIMRDVYAAIRSLVPAGIWTGLMSQRDQYEQDYFEEQ